MFHALALLTDLHEGYRKGFKINGVSLLLLEVGSQRYIIEDRCPHMDALLSTGKVVGTDIVCRAHGIAFSLSTGQAKGPLSSSLDCLNSFPVVYDGNRVGVEL